MIVLEETGVFSNEELHKLRDQLNRSTYGLVFKIKII